MLFLSENDLKNFFGDVIQNVAKELNLQDREWLFHAEILEQVKTENTAVFEKLEDFFAAYKNWNDFHTKIDQENKTGNLSTEEHKALSSLISTRDSARKSLLETLRK